MTKKFKISLIFLTSLLLFSALPYFLGPGLTTPVPMGNYLNGAFSSISTANEEPYRVAFDNLRFFYPITFKMVPNQNKIILGQLDGKIYWFENDEETENKNLILDLSDEVGVVWDGGFLGLTIHPEYGALTGKDYFYIYYTTKDANGENFPNSYTGQNCTLEQYFGNYLILERFEVNPTTMEFIDGSRTTILKNRMYGSSHRGGGIDFGNDGFLYLTVGDQTAWQKAQDITNNLDGGVLRMDVDKDPNKSHAPIRTKPTDAGMFDEISGTEYWIPNDNPFLSPSGNNFEEYWSLGFRSPHRLTKDKLNGTIYIGDVGLNTHDEIDILQKGKNYGWPLYEGFVAGPGCVPELLNDMDHETPLVSFPPEDVNSIIGGYVYRGTDLPDLYGKYICADYGTGDEIWSVDTVTGDYEQIGVFLPEDVISFGEDDEGELFILKAGVNTPIYKMKSTSVSYDQFPQLLSDVGAFTDLTNLEVANGIIPYDLVESFWSDGASKKRWMAIPNNGNHDTESEQINYSENGDWEFPIGTVLIKHFDLQIDDNDPSITRKVETRFSIMGEDGKFYFLTYNWNEDETDATLQATGLDETINIITDTGGTRTQTWHFPSNSECITCHNSATKGALGLRTRYLNKDYTYPLTDITANQLVTLSHLGILNETITDTDTPTLLTGKSMYDPNATLDEKARSYLDLNCAYCHRPDTGNRASFDLRLFNNLEATELLSSGVLSTLGIPDEKIVFPGDASKSILYHRINSVDPAIMMPPLAKSVVDDDAAAMIEAWINQLDPVTNELNSPDASINLALLSSAIIDGSINGGRGNIEDILYDPRIEDYLVVTSHNEYGVAYNANLGTPDIDDAFRWQVNWPTPKLINYITFGGTYPNQPQPNALWKISYLNDGNWLMLDEGQGGWIDSGIYQWGGSNQLPITASAIKVEIYSDGTNELISIHLRARGSKSTVRDDSDQPIKATLIQYLPPTTTSNCSITSIDEGTQGICNSTNNYYTQDLVVSYTDPPAAGNLIVNGQAFPITTSPQTVTLTNLTANELAVDVTANFSDESSCAILINDLFTAPSPCSNCSIDSVILGSQSSCNIVNNTYAQDLIINYTDAPTTGNLVVNGQTFPITTSPQTITLANLTANELAVDVTVNFSDETSCTLLLNELFTAPSPCINCSIDSVVLGTQSNCNIVNNAYSQDLIINYTDAPATGNLVVNGQTFPITTSPQTVTLTNLTANELAVDVTVNFSDDPTCSVSISDLFTAPSACSVSENPTNSPDDNINLGLIPDALLTGSVTNGRGALSDILYDPAADNYTNVTDYNEYGVNYNFNLGKPNVDNGFKWQVDWSTPKYINYITFGGTYPNQPQPNSMWRISYLRSNTWITLSEGKGGWIDSGIFEWGGDNQQPIIADALRVQVYSDGNNDLVSIHLRGRGGISTENDDHLTITKGTLIQYIPLNDSCGLNLTPDALLYCNSIWKDGILPSETSDLKDLFIGNGTYVINEDENIKVNNLEVSISAGLTIKEGGSVTVLGDLINDGNIVLESTATKYSSLIVEGNSAGFISYNRHVNAFNGDTGNDLISSPLNGIVFGDFASKNPNLYENPNNTQQKLFGPFNETTGTYGIYATDVNRDTDLTMGMGYRAARESLEDAMHGTTLTFYGGIVTETVIRNITTSGSSFDGWNLIGNPFTSYIDFDAFFEQNKSQLNGGSYQAIYGYDGNATDGWTVLNGLSTGKLIAPGQGFFVKSKDTGGTITFTPQMRVNGSTDDFIAGREISAHFGHLKLKASAINSQYFTDFYFNSNATSGLDPGYDAALFSGDAPSFSIYSHLVENDTGVPFMIQALSESAMNNITVALGINASQGQELTISILESDMPDYINIYLEDRTNNTFTLLNSEDYIFTADTDLSGIGRFYLRFEEDRLSTVDSSIESLKILANQNARTIEILGQLQNKTSFKLFDIHGRSIILENLDINSTHHIVDVNHLQKGIYIVELESASGSKRIQKLIIK